MNNRTITLSLLMAVAAVFFVQSYVSSIEEETQKRFGTEVLVVKAKRDIKEQETLDETLLETVRVPKRFLEPAAIYFDQKTDDTVSKKAIRDLAGSVAVVPIRKGEQITSNKLTEPSIRTGLSPQIAPGRRAVAIPVNEVSGVAKLVKPGDRVDVMAVLDLGGGAQGGRNKIVKTLLQDAVVLSVGRNVTNNVARVVEYDQVSGKERIKPLTTDSSFASITLEVEPQQAQLLALVLADSGNQLMLALRNNDDTDRVGLDVSTLQDVLGQRGPASGQPLPAGGGMGGGR